MSETNETARRSYANVILVQRVLSILQSLNRTPIITVKTLSQDCGIPPSSVVRILETLCAEGFLEHVSREAGYRLKPKICSLSSGFHGAPLVVEIAKVHADELTRKHLWPLSVATLDRDAMVIQYSSIPLSPMAHVRTTLHKRLSLLTRAHGIAYLAHCSSMERHRLLRIAVDCNRGEDRAIADARHWRRQIVQTRRRGYAVRVPEIDPSTRTIAVPIMIEPGRVVATLGMTFFKRSVRDAQIPTLSSALKASAEQAAERLRAEIVLRAPSLAREGAPPRPGRGPRAASFQPAESPADGRPRPEPVP